MRLHYYLLIATFFFTSGTVATPIPEKVNLFGLEPKRTDPPQCTEKVFLGIDLLQEEGFEELQGKRVALLSHKAAVNREGILTATILHENQLLNDYTFTTIFTPEHGFAADVAAGEKITDCEISTQSQYPGVQIHTLYGNILKPSPEMLKEIDLLVIDLQTLGVRYYTYSATARFAMEACFENGVSVLVLDRPNPHGGLYIEGNSSAPAMIQVRNCTFQDNSAQSYGAAIFAKGSGSGYVIEDCFFINNRAGVAG